MKSLERAVHLLEVMAAESAADWSISDLAAQTGFSLATVHRMLTAWERVGFVGQNPVTRRYRLGMRLMELGVALWRRLDIRTAARPVMLRLAQQVRQSTYLTVRDGLDGVIIDLVEGPSPLRVVPPIGLRLPLHVGGSKKVLIAHLLEAERERIIAALPLRAHTGRTVTDPDRLRQDLARIREQGYIVTFGEALEGTAGVAVPIWNAESRVVAGLMSAGPEADFTADRLPEIIRATVAAGREISAVLGYREREGLGREAP